MPLWLQKKKTKSKTKKVSGFKISETWDSNFIQAFPFFPGPPSFLPSSLTVATTEEEKNPCLSSRLRRLSPVLLSKAKDEVFKFESTLAPLLQPPLTPTHRPEQKEEGEENFPKAGFSPSPSPPPSRHTRTIDLAANASLLFLFSFFLTLQTNSLPVWTSTHLCRFDPPPTIRSESRNLPPRICTPAPSPWCRRGSPRHRLRSRGSAGGEGVGGGGGAAAGPEVRWRYSRDLVDAGEEVDGDEGTTSRASGVEEGDGRSPGEEDADAAGEGGAESTDMGDGEVAAEAEAVTAAAAAAAESSALIRSVSGTGMGGCVAAPAAVAAVTAATGDDMSPAQSGLDPGGSPAHPRALGEAAHFCTARGSSFGSCRIPRSRCCWFSLEWSTEETGWWCPESGWKARPEETIPSWPSVSFSFRIFCSFSWRARPHSTPLPSPPALCLALSRPSSLLCARAEWDWRRGGRDPIQGKFGSNFGAEGRRAPHRPAYKKEKGTLPSLLPKRDGFLFPLIGIWQPGTTLESRHVTSQGRKAKKMPINSKYR